METHENRVLDEAHVGSSRQEEARQAGAGQNANQKDKCFVRGINKTTQLAEGEALQTLLAERGRRTGELGEGSDGATKAVAVACSNGHVQQLTVQSKMGKQQRDWLQSGNKIRNRISSEDREFRIIIEREEVDDINSSPRALSAAKGAAMLLSSKGGAQQTCQDEGVEFKEQV
jgi:hypothetical protein